MTYPFTQVRTAIKQSTHDERWRGAEVREAPTLLGRVLWWSHHEGWVCPDGPVGKESTCTAEYPAFDSWAGKIPWRRERLPTPVFWLGEFHGLYSPWGRKELDTTEQLWRFLKN